VKCLTSPNRPGFCVYPALPVWANRVDETSRVSRITGHGPWSCRACASQASGVSGTNNDQQGWQGKQGLLQHSGQPEPAEPGQHGQQE
jgi:hypothetical protein